MRACDYAQLYYEEAANRRWTLLNELGMATAAIVTTVAEADSTQAEKTPAENVDAQQHACNMHEGVQDGMQDAVCASGPDAHISPYLASSSPEPEEDVLRLSDNSHLENFQEQDSHMDFSDDERPGLF